MRTLFAIPFGQMRLQIMILIFGLLTYRQVNGQLILTEQDNFSWTNKLRTEKNMALQFEMLRMRLTADTNVHVKNFGDRVILKTGKNKEKADAVCRPLIIVSGQFIDITNDTDRKEIEKLTGKLTKNNFSEIKILEDNQASALYGRRGVCGAILLTPKNKRVKKEILRIKI